MRKRIFKILFTLFIIQFGINDKLAFAQQDPDLHFSHFMFNNLVINPSYAGKSNDISLATFYRNQWVGFKGAPTTQSFSAHSPIPGKNFGGGLHIINDAIGLEKHLTGMLSGAYHIHTRKSVLSLGLSGGFKQFTIDKAQLILQDTVSDRIYAQLAGTTVFNSSFGMHYRTKEWYAAFSITNLNQAKLKYNANTVSKLSRHYYVKAGYNYQINKLYAFRPTVLVKYQPSSPIQIYFNGMIDYKGAYWAGLGYRTGDAASFMVGAHIEKIKQLKFKEHITIGYAFDWTMNGLPSYSAGSHEIMLLYDYHLNVNSKVHNPKYKRLE